MTRLRQLTLELQDPEELPRLPENQKEVIEAMAGVLLAVLAGQERKEADDDAPST
jgi:hypothetical protein